MSSFFGKIGHGLEHFGQQVGHEVKHIVTGNPTPDPRRFSSPTTTMPTSYGSPTTSPYGALPGGPTQPPPVPGLGTSGISGDSAGFTPDQEAQLRNGLSAAGIWDTIQGIGGDAWGVIKGFLPKNADGSVDWGKVGGDVVGWIKDNKDTILQGLSAYNQYQRQQQSDKYAGQALNGIPGTSYKGAIQEYADKAPLRVAGINGMQFAASHGNPFSASFTPPSLSAGPLPVAGVSAPLNTAPATMPGGSSPLPVLPSLRPPSSGAIPRQGTTAALDALPVAGMMPSDAVLPTAAQPNATIQDGSAIPTDRAPSVGSATTPPNPGNTGTPAPLRVATIPGGGKAPLGLKRANELEMQKLFA